MMSYPIQEIFGQSLDALKEEHNLTFQQAKVAHNISNCKTNHFGGHMTTCEDCGHEHIYYNSCRDRHCPCCQSLVKEKWIDKTKASLIDAPYFHTVFTVPHELNEIFYNNQKIMYNLFYSIVSLTLKELALDPRHKLEAEIGFISILHTWGRNISYHPHIHVIVLAGGLNSHHEFVQRESDFLFPFPVLKTLFRGKFLDTLNELWIKNKLDYKPILDSKFVQLKNRLYKKQWIIYAKKTFNRAESVIEYLGRYTHNIAISNSRITSYNQEKVTFKYKDHKTQAKKIMTLSTIEFIRRFLMHVLPNRFVKIRYYGILSNRNKKEKLSIIREKIDSPMYVSELLTLTTAEIILTLYKIDLTKCKKCASSNLSTRKIRKIKKE